MAPRQCRRSNGQGEVAVERKLAHYDWDTVNFYADSHKAIGLGHKVLEIPKLQYQATFGDADVEAILEDLDGRWATLRLLMLERFAGPRR